MTSSVLPPHVTCPSCQQVTPLPAQVAPTAVLRCPHCRAQFALQDLLVEPQIVWEVISEPVSPGAETVEMSDYQALLEDWEDEPTDEVYELNDELYEPTADVVFGGGQDDQSPLQPQEPLQFDESQPIADPANAPGTPVLEVGPEESKPRKLEGPLVGDFPDDPELELEYPGDSSWRSATVRAAGNQAQLKEPAALGELGEEAAFQSFSNGPEMRGKRPRRSPVWFMLQVSLGGLAAIPVSLLLMWHLLGTDIGDAAPWVAQYAPWIVPQKFHAYAPPSSVAANSAQAGSTADPAASWPRQPDLDQAPQAADLAAADETDEIPSVQPRALSDVELATDAPNAANDPFPSDPFPSDPFPSESPANEPSANESPANESPANEPPANEPPVNEPPVNESSVNESSANESPVNESPVNESPANESLLSDTLVNSGRSDGGRQLSQNNAAELADGVNSIDDLMDSLELDNGSLAAMLDSLELGDAETDTTGALADSSEAAAPTDANLDDNPTTTPPSDLDSADLENCFTSIRKADSVLEEWSLAVSARQHNMALAQETYSELASLALAIGDLPSRDLVQQAMRGQLRPVRKQVEQKHEVRSLIDQGARFWIRSQSQHPTETGQESTDLNAVPSETGRYGLATTAVVDSITLSSDGQWSTVTASATTQSGGIAKLPLDLWIPQDLIRLLPEGKLNVGQKLFLLGTVELPAKDAVDGVNSASGQSPMIANYLAPL